MPDDPNIEAKRAALEREIGANSPPGYVALVLLLIRDLARSEPVDEATANRLFATACVLLQGGGVSQPTMLAAIVRVNNASEAAMRAG